ncbi:hypothetical protein [Oryzomicrobium sp.]|uniref:hypothetical protein n=1 Tax=Oryzomicrobium sp. TaxID=1911578 RepID=UPI0025F63CB2|nr:hypothetical protein [Oryzomicrobium sp.]MCE1242148.1 hypothetical protein [Oryzomicrobium sp.]
MRIPILMAAALLGLTAQAVQVTQAAPAKAPEVALVCGGVGAEESAPMLADAHNHALTVLFAGPGGAYLSGVQTQIGGPKGAFASDPACGPIGQVDVTQAGRYTVQATYAGKRETQTVSLTPKGGGRLVLRWAN